MAKIKLTVRQIMNLGLWSKVCEYKGWSEWIYNEGQIEDYEIIEFDDEFNKEPVWEKIDFKDAIELIKANWEVKVIFNDGTEKIVDEFEYLNGFRFRDFFDATFYKVVSN